MKTIEKIKSWCPISKKVVNAKIVQEGRKIYLEFICGNRKIRSPYRWEDSIIYKIIRHMYRSKDYKWREFLFDRLGVDITPLCNLDCPFCDIKSEMKKFWTPNYAQIRKIIKRWKIDEITFSGGEALLRKDLPKIIKRLNKEFPHLQIGILSNGLTTSNESLIEKYTRLKNVGFIITYSIDEKSSMIMHGVNIIPFQKKTLQLLEDMNFFFGISTTVTKYSFSLFVREIKRLTKKFDHLSSIRLAPIFYSASNEKTKELSRLSPTSSQLLKKFMKHFKITPIDLYRMQAFNHSIKIIYEILRFGDYKRFRCPFSVFMVKKNGKLKPITAFYKFKLQYIFLRLLSSKLFRYLFWFLHLFKVGKLSGSLLREGRSRIILVSFFSYFNPWNVDIRFLKECNGRNIINEEMIEKPVSFCKYFMVGWR